MDFSLSFLVFFATILCGAFSNQQNFAEEYETFSEGDFIPTKKISGTDLYSGIFYKIGMKKFPQGWITWTERQTKDGTGNYVQIDINPNNLPHYKPGEKWFKDIQWILEPSEREVYFTLKNKAHLNGLVTSTIEKDGGYRYMIVANKTELVSKLLPKGQLRTDALIKLIETDENKSKYKYQFKLYNHPEGTVTWTEEKYGDYSKFIQVSENENHRAKYVKGQEWWDDTLFSLEPEIEESVELLGFLSHIELTEDSKSIMEKYQRHVNTSNIKILRVENPTEYPERVKIEKSNVDKSAGVMKINDKLPPLTISSIFKIPDLRTWELAHSSTLMIEPSKSNLSGSDYIQIIAKRRDFTKVIQVSPKRKVDISIVANSLQDIQLPFRAMMVITGKGDRLLSGHSGVGKGSIPADIVMRQLLNFDDKADENNFKIMSNNKVITWVTGTITGTFSLGFDVNVESSMF